MLKHRGRNLEAFDSGQYGDGWCDERIAIEQRGSDDSNNQDDSAGSPKRADEFRKMFETHVKAARNDVMRKMFAPIDWGFGRGGFNWSN